MSSRKAPIAPVCKQCRSPILWAHDDRGKAVPVDAYGLADDARIDQPRFDAAVHRRHVCGSWFEQLRSQIGAQIDVFDGQYLSGELLAAEGDYLAVRRAGNRVTLVVREHVHHVTFGVEHASDTQDST